MDPTIPSTSSDETAREPAYGLDHVQITIPQGAEAEARAFYENVLGLREVPAPEALESRGVFWFALGAQSLHVGIEKEFQPSRRGHPALLIHDLEAMRRRLADAGVAVREDVPLPGVLRCFVSDPFGNRIELVQRVAPPPWVSDDPTMPVARSASGEASSPADAERIKRQVREVFSESAEDYVSSATHAEGEDLARLITLADPRPSDVALDISTGGGHVALALSPRVGRVVASDLTPKMLAAARRFLRRRGAENTEFVLADAENLPFLDETFSLVTVRIAPHHYADVRKAVVEMARVLAPEGRLLLIDNIAPPDPMLDALLNEWEVRRDPSHVREYTESEWRAFITQAGLTIRAAEISRKRYEYAPWAARTRMTPEAQRSLATDILNAPPAAQRYFEIQNVGGNLTTWSSEYLLVHAIKPA